VYYGLEMIKAVMANRPPEIQKVLAQKIAKIEGLRHQVGVEWFGRVSIAAVSEAMKGAGVFAYPVDFDEAFCAAAARAQACGCWPVVYNRAALAETVAWGRVATPESFVDDCVAMAQTPEDRNGMRAWARSAFAWERVADKFERMMEEP
jgi:glycosyltransferase involved in cell wall biosynthesis